MVGIVAEIDCRRIGTALKLESKMPFNWVTDLDICHRLRTQFEPGFLVWSAFYFRHSVHVRDLACIASPEGQIARVRKQQRGCEFDIGRCACRQIGSPQGLPSIC